MLSLESILTTGRYIGSGVFSRYSEHRNERAFVDKQRKKINFLQGMLDNSHLSPFASPRYTYIHTHTYTCDTRMKTLIRRILNSN